MNGSIEGVLRLVFRVSGYILFFGWNLWFLAWLGLGLAPLVLFEALVATVVGMIPASFALFAVVLLATPAVGVLLSLHPRLRVDPGRLLSLFYGVQFPVMLLCLVRLFAIQQLTWPVGLGLVVVGVGALGLLRTLLVGPRERSAAAQVARLVAQSGYLLAGWWWAALVGLYAVILPAGMLRLVLRALYEAATRPWGGGAEMPFVLLLAGLSALSAVVLLVFPVAMVGVSSRAFQLVHRATAERIGGAAATAVAVATVVGWVVAIGLTGRQAQGAAFEALASARTDADRREVLERSDEIRRGLLSARLAVERTLESDPKGEHVEDLWGEIAPAAATEGARRVWVGLTWPFVYHPHHEGDRWWRLQDVAEASPAYAAFFDAPMEVAERPTLLAASRATWSWEDAQAGLLEVGQQKVHLDAQEIVVEPHGDVAEVTVHEVYRNRTWDAQEVLVYFSLPESAAVTGLWLGPDADRERAFRYVVAPRGAAQQVYEEQVRVSRDPALLEQVGPRQYRLRAFPVLAREGRPDDVWSIRAEGPELHLWLEVVVPLVEEEDGVGFFPLPRATEVRNLFWDSASTRSLDGATFSSEDWLPARVDAPSAVRRTHAVVIDGWQVTAEPADAVTPRRLGTVAVLVDGTRSMDRHRAEVGRALARLRTASDEVVVLCTIEQALTRCPSYDPELALAWGATALETRLVEASKLAAGADALIVLTDEGSYPLAAAAEQAGLPDVALPPLWLVHLGADPQAYPDWTLDRLQRTHGGVASSVDEVLARISDPTITGGYRWSFAPATAGPSPADPFDPLAARQLVAHLDRMHRSGALATLDELHAVAVRHHVVTPYSSMLVLVEEQQRQRLAELSGQEDRFEREVTDGQEVLELSSAPEPATWLMLGLGAAGLAGARLRRRSFGRHELPMSQPGVITTTTTNADRSVSWIRSHARRERGWGEGTLVCSRPGENLATSPACASTGAGLVSAGNGPFQIGCARPADPLSGAGRRERWWRRCGGLRIRRRSSRRSRP